MKSLRIILGAVGGTLLASLPSLAADMGPIAIHGALSTTGAYSDTAPDTEGTSAGAVEAFPSTLSLGLK